MEELKKYIKSLEEINTHVKNLDDKDGKLINLKDRLDLLSLVGNFLIASVNFDEAIEKVSDKKFKKDLKEVIRNLNEYIYIVKKGEDTYLMMDTEEIDEYLIELERFI